MKKYGTAGIPFVSSILGGTREGAPRAGQLSTMVFIHITIYNILNLAVPAEAICCLDRSDGIRLV
jgi:hypothetical protein